uniref:Uncharacterized protein n=1 Tax=Chelonoidis abingdonii TaxID=106734 RepID=A0A8C0G5F2_CHEAB
VPPLSPPVHRADQETKKNERTARMDSERDREEKERQRGELMSPSLVAGWEQMEETFVASSTGEGMELIDMVQNEDAQRLRNAVVKDLLEPVNQVTTTGTFPITQTCLISQPP